ncbi:MAG: hypothetical protein K8R02_04435 [Anaerohalosphaeraceae bacterium]|nr:hypothetical protein [Anaerohalosphaeraceae bacterium]
MKTERKKNMLAVGLIISICLIAVFFADSIQGSEKSYEIKPEITIPQYQTDATRAINAYERLMERFMGMAEGNFYNVNAEMKDISRKLILLDSKISILSEQLTRIEKIVTPKKSENTDPNAAQAEGIEVL